MGGATVIVVFTALVPVPGGFRVANDGSEAVRVIWAPTTPVALTGTDREEPSATVTSSMGVIVSVGALATWICVTPAPTRPFVAVNTTSYSPSSDRPGVQLNSPDVLEPLGVNVAPVGRPEAIKLSMASPSASLTLTVKLRFDPAVTSRRGGALTTGARSEPAALTVIWKISMSSTPPAVAVTAAV